MLWDLFKSIYIRYTKKKCIKNALLYQIKVKNNSLEINAQNEDIQQLIK